MISDQDFFHDFTTQLKLYVWLQTSVMSSDKLNVTLEFLLACLADNSIHRFRASQFKMKAMDYRLQTRNKM